MCLDSETDLGVASVEVDYRPAIPARRFGHPDRWSEGEDEELDVVAAHVDGVSIDTDELDLDQLLMSARRAHEAAGVDWRLDRGC